MENQQYIILAKCADCTGLIYKITSVLYHQGLNIIKNDEYVDPENGTFFTRTEAEGPLVDCEFIESEVKKVLSENSFVKCTVPQKKKIILMGTKDYHCYTDILTRNHFNQLDADILCAISNRDSLREITERYGVPYSFISTKDLKREDHEAKVAEVIDQFEFDYIVLAKYMRILTPSFVEKYHGKIINIHHSFLPAFIGANPYRQAYERGVKIIGATAHFVNNELDQGPIIEQGVMRIGHQHNVKQMAAAGKEVERDVLAKALKMVFNDRVLLNGNKTVVF